MPVQKNNSTQTIKQNSPLFVYTLLIAVVIATFFLRGFELPSSYIRTTSYLIPIIVLLMLIYLGIASQDPKLITFPRQQYILLCSFIFLLTTSIIYNYLVFELEVSVLQFTIELYLNVVLFICVFILSRQINTQYILDSILISGFAFALLILYIGFVELEIVYRVGTTHLPISVNHLSHALAAAFAIGLCRFYYRGNRLNMMLIVLPTILVALILTGARSGLLAVSVAIGLLVVFHGWSFIMRSATAIIGGSLAFIAFATSVIEFRGDGGTDRVSYTVLVDGLSGRFGLFLEVLTLIFSSPQTILFGVAMENYVLFANTAIIADPHNIWLSFGLYFGIPSAIAFLLLHASIFIKATQMIVSGRDQTETMMSLFLMLVIVSIYVFFSGRMTRIFTIWVVMALVLGRVVTISKANTNIGHP